MSFLRQFFGLGPSKEEAEAWRQLGSEIGAEFIREGFWGQQARVVAEVKEWTITLDTDSIYVHMAGMATYTRMAAPYMTVPHLQVKRSPDGTPMARRADGKSLTPEDREEARRLAKDGFQFTIYRKGFFNAVGKLLGIQDSIAVGDSEFDRDFIIKGSSNSKVRALFANPRIRQLIQRQPSLYLSVQKDEFFCELYFQGPGFIKDVVRLKSLFELFEETLNHLRRIG